MSDIIFNISGGNNQILPNATQATQNFYGDQFAEKHLEKSTENASPAEAASNSPSPEEDALGRFISRDNIPVYISRLGNCQNASDVGKVVIDMYQQESRLCKEEIVRVRFINCLLPFITHIAKGTSVDNLRVQINKELEKLPHSLRTSR